MQITRMVRLPVLFFSVSKSWWATNRLLFNAYDKLNSLFISLGVARWLASEGRVNQLQLAWVLGSNQALISIKIGLGKEIKSEHRCLWSRRGDGPGRAGMGQDRTRARYMQPREQHRISTIVHHHHHYSQERQMHCPSVDSHFFY